MKSYVVNLERFIEWCEAISKQLRDVDVSFEIFNAIDGSKDFEDKWHYNDKKRKLLRVCPFSSEKIAHFVSLYQLKKKCVELIEPIRILAGDAVPPANFEQTLGLAANLLNK